MDGEECSSCLICHDPLLVSTVGALNCGHVYHRNCIVLWLADGKAECPQCKKKNRIDDVRTLDFELKQVPGLSDEEVHRLEATTLEERARHREELSAGKAEAEAVSAQVNGELALLRDLAQERKRARKEVETDGKLLLEANGELTTELSGLKASCAGLQAGLDAEAPRLQRKLPISQPREGDPDLQEERRKLKAGFRAGERARRVHEALISARQQENEKQHDNADRIAALKRAEDELRDLRQREVQLRQELDDRRSAGASQVSSQATLSVPSTGYLMSTLSVPSTASTSLARIQASVTQPPPVVRREVTVEVATPQGVANLRRETEQEDEDTDMLYGGVRPGLSARGGLLGRPRSGSAAPSGGNGPAIAKAGGGKWGALFGASGTSKPPAALTATPPPERVKVSMKSLFANNRYGIAS